MFLRDSLAKVLEIPMKYNLFSLALAILGVLTLAFEGTDGARIRHLIAILLLWGSGFAAAMNRYK